MNASQKGGLAIIFGMILFSLPAALQAFGVVMPGWLPIAVQVTTSILGVLGVYVQSPASRS